MSDPRNVAHAKKVTQEKKHQGTETMPTDAPAVQPGKKPAAAKKKSRPAGPAAVPDNVAAVESAVPSAKPTPPAAVEGSLVVLTKLKELEFHSRANLERLAELALTVEDELKQKDIVSPLAEVIKQGVPATEIARSPRFQTSMSSGVVRNEDRT